jgi:hypothetical protein
VLTASLDDTAWTEALPLARSPSSGHAPTIKAGTQLLVGFHEETYRQVLG